LQINNELFKKLDNIINRFDFKKIDIDFKKIDYAIYNEGNLYTRGENEPFFSSYDNPTMYNNLAIVTNDLNSVEEMAVSLISTMYEMFLSSRYKMIIPNYLNIVESKHNFLQVNYYLYEIKILKLSDRTNDLNIKRAYLRLFINTRHQRSEMENGFTLDEMKAEHFNGSVAYAHIAIIKQIYGNKSLEVKEYLYKLNSRFDNFFNKMNGSYITGYYLKKILIDLGYTLMPQTLLYNVCVAYVDYVNEMITLPKNSKAIKLIQSRENQSKEILNDYFLLEPKKVPYSGKIKTFDPLSVVKFENRYYFNNFVVLEDDSGVSTYITGPVVVSYEDGRVLSYFKRSEIE